MLNAVQDVAVATVYTPSEGAHFEEHEYVLVRFAVSRSPVDVILENIHGEAHGSVRFRHCVAVYDWHSAYIHLGTAIFVCIVAARIVYARA